MSDISPVKIDIKADLTPAIDKIVDTIVAPVQGIHKGITKIISACSGKWFANRERQIELIAAQTAKDVEDIKSGKKEYRNGELLNIELAPTMADYYRQVSEHNGACDAKRLEAAMFTAALELFNTPEEEISDEPLNQTFFNHWRAEAELIDDDDLRQWWAHLLVEETKKPHSISPRTLEVAKKLSREEAQLFEKLNIGISEGFLLTNAEDVPATGTFSDILTLQDAELINPQKAERHCKKAENSNNIISFIRTGYVLEIVSKYDIVLTGHRLTRAGKDLYDIMPPKKITLSDMIKVASIISKCNHTSSVSLHEIENISIDGETQTITYSDTPVWINKNISEGNLK